MWGGREPFPIYWNHVYSPIHKQDIPLASFAHEIHHVYPMNPFAKKSLWKCTLFGSYTVLDKCFSLQILSSPRFMHNLEEFQERSSITCTLNDAWYITLHFPCLPVLFISEALLLANSMARLLYFYVYMYIPVNTESWILCLHITPFFTSSS